MHIPSSIVHLGSAAEVLRSVPTASVDSVITSPPYFGVCDYVKSQRLTLEWLGIDVEPLRLRETGARSKRRRKAAAADYVCELTTVFREIRRVLRPGGFFALVFGESDKRNSVSVDIEAELERVGFHRVSGLGRNISYQRRQTPSILTEQVWIYERQE